MTALLQPPLYINDRTEESFAGSVYPQREAAVTPLSVDVVIGSTLVHDAIINGAAQVNIMVFHAMESLNLTPTGPSTHQREVQKDF